MLIHIQDDILRLWGMGLLEPLLADRTTGQNILWATDAYEDEYGHRFARDEEITAAKITEDYAGLICTRARKAFEQQSQRTRQRAEVFTPLWIVEKMNDHLDEEWFQRKDGIHKQDEAGRIAFNTKKTWQQYVENRRLEITCGEAPFLTTRYDAVSGEVLPIEKRVGLLDRKLRVVSENTENAEEWFTWALRALRATYGYEFQGDSLLIARLNVMMSVWEAMEIRWGQPPTASQLRKAVEIVTWNLWQMDGLTDRTPYAKEDLQLSLFDLLPDAKPVLPSFCRIKNWRQQRTNQFRSLKGERTRMKFDFVIGNPPYQDTTLGDNDTYAPPIYDKFLDESFKIGEKIELIHPARFLFNAGSTPKAWNKKMLDDTHFKILSYFPRSKDVFSNNIKGGIAISYHDDSCEYVPIGVFTQYEELNTILYKVRQIKETSFSTVIVTSYAYHLTEKFYQDYPNLLGSLSEGHDYDFKSNIFEKMPSAFFDTCPDDGEEYVRIMGRTDNSRIYKYIKKAYVNDVKNLYKYKVFMSGANGTGKYGETLVYNMGFPAEGSTETYMSIGSFDSEAEAVAASKYISTKFARALLGIRKVTQAMTPGKWEHVPLQVFSNESDIDWSQSVADIDRQLYAKYGLDEKEIEFIETHVKEMA